MDADNLVPDIVTALKRRSTELVASLSPLAAVPARSRGRERPEVEDGRDPYQIDRERIVRTKTFRRLMHKTQVFMAPVGDHYLTR